MAARANLDEPGGEIAVGHLVLKIGDPRGAELREATRANPVHLRPRPTPILLRPGLIRGFVDRRSEAASAVAALGSGIAVEISGEPGVGKTALLRHLAHHPHAASYADGILYLSASHQTCLDLLQRIFEAFYESETLSKPTDAEIRRGLQHKQALILLDDVSLSQSDLEHVLAVAPRSAFVIAARERCLWSEVRGLALEGLPVDDAVMFLERELDRSLDATERSAAPSLCAALGYHPLRMRQAAAVVREGGITLEEWARLATPESLTAELLTSIDEKERRVLLALSALAGVHIEAMHVSSIAEVTDGEALLLTLLRRGLVLRHESRYRLADGVADRLRRTEDMKPWVNRAVTYFTAWTERHRRSQENLLQTLDALIRVQEHAVDVKRWGEALRLGRLLEGTLLLAARWGACGIVLERSLTAARAIGDRAVEAWLLHEIGTRAVCLNDAATARRMLNQAAKLRTELGESGAARISRENLGFIATERTVDDPSRGHSATPFDHVRGIDSLRLRYQAYAARRGSRRREVGAMLITLLLCATLGGFAYVVISGRGPIFRSPDPGEPLPTAPTGPATAPSTSDTPAAPVTPLTPIARDAPAAAPTERASILIFTVRPGSIATAAGPSQLCYAVRNALQARIEPAVGEIVPANTLTCRRVAPPRTTTYELIASGQDGVQVRQQLVIVVR